MVIELLILAVALSMDAFAVAICKGLGMKKATLGKAAVVGGWFGAFQALMPAIGFVLAGILTRFFGQYLEMFTGWIAFILLAIIGGNMIKEALEKKEEGCSACENTDASLSVRVMFPMAVATSIDAMVVGVGYGLRPDMTIPRVLLSVTLIGVITFALSALGVKIGNIFGDKYEKKAQLAGGIVLCLLGVKNVLDQYGVIDAVWNWFLGIFA
ncbi:MAG: manganese efflux pump [Clostridia bacterium]|nr:manganese efflux pump [Clostridia bacterium]